MYNVLLVERNPMVQKLLEIFLSSGSRCQLVHSMNGVACAEQFFTTHPVDLILMDMTAIMEDDGLERVKELKMRFPNVKIIMITDLPEYSYISCAKQIGAESFWYMEPVAESLFAIMDKTMEGKSIYPDSVPVSKLGCALSTDFTERELEVLREVVGGKTDAAIAEALTLSVSTVKFHIQKIREKTGFTTRTELAVRTRESGLVISQ